MVTKNRKEELLAAFEAKIAQVNKACTEGTNAEVESRLSELTSIEKEFRAIREREVFAGLMDAHEAIQLHHFTTIGHKKTTDEGRMTGVEKADRTVQVDLGKFCEVRGFDMGWYYEVQALNKRLTLRVAESIGVPASEMKEIDGSYNMNRLAEEIDLGKTPTSDTQVVKHMQKILDMLSPDEGRVNKYDLAYIMATYTKRNNKALLRVQCSKHGVLLSLLTDVFYRISTNGVYGVDYKRNIAVSAEPNAEKDSASKARKDSKSKAKKRTTAKKPKTEETEAAPVEASETESADPAPEAIAVEKESDAA